MSNFITLLCLRGVSQTTTMATLIHLLTQNGRLRLVDALSDQRRPPEGGREYGVPAADAASGWSVIICPEPFESLAADMSRLLGAPTFLFHLHDGDSWLYWFFNAGRELDRYDSLPGYWADSDDAELTAVRGRPAVLANALGLNAATLAPYLVRAGIDPEEQVREDYDDVDKALELLATDARVHPDDKYDLWDARVMFDFMRRLGITAPVSPTGQPTGPLTILRFEPTS